MSNKIGYINKTIIDIVFIVIIYLLSFSAIAIDNQYAKRLIKAIETENIDLIDNMIEGQDINELENYLVDGTPPIFYAASCYPSSLKKMIELGFDINLIHIESELKPISVSVLSDDMVCYEILKSHHAINHLSFKEKYEIMDYAVMKRNQTVIDDLIGHDFNYLDDSLGISMIELAIYHGRSYLFIPHIENKVKNGGLDLIMR